MNALGIAMGFWVVGFVGGMGLFLALTGTWHMLHGSEARVGLVAGTAIRVETSRELAQFVLNGVLALAGLGLMVFTGITVYNVIFG